VRAAALIAAAVAAFALPGCAEPGVTCAPGTVAVDGACVLDDEAIAVHCGAGTRYDPPTASCVGDPALGECYGGEIVDDGDARTCVCGANARASCSSGPPCAAPPAGVVRVCGHLLDLETSEQLIDLDDGEPPDPEGPCALALAAYDAADFASDPDAAEPLDTLAWLDRCGRFRIDLPLPPSGFLAIAARDPSAETRAPSAITLPATSRVVGVRLPVAALATLELWAASLELDGPGLDERGAAVVRLLHQGAFVAGATLPGAPYYFADTDPYLLTTLDPARTETGPTGAALELDGEPTSAPPSGGLPDGCTWPDTLRYFIADVVHHTEIQSVCQ
jgi:hypothetical protein